MDEDKETNNSLSGRDAIITVLQCLNETFVKKYADTWKRKKSLKQLFSTFGFMVDLLCFEAHSDLHYVM